MQDFFNLVMLVCASLASMGFGILAAYALIKGGFAMMHWHSQQQAPEAVKAQAQVARVS